MPPATTSEETPSTGEILATSSWLTPIPKFWHLLPHAKTLIRHYGPHTIFADTTVLVRANTPRSTKLEKLPSAKLLARSFAAAQDAHGSAQPDGPAKEDLELFTLLWRTTIEVVDQILEDGIADGEAFGWGVYGLSFGYIPSFPSPPSADNSTSFDALRQRLHTTLLTLPNVNNPQRERERSSISPAERVGRLVKARNEVHLCGTLLVQRFREEEWASVRWGHLIAVVERWLGNLELGVG
ncbi:hypothetical protein K458DRAFT_322868 [Lentithecium fluviatile CBS 122367]|uniref:Uncharacterized protein n=1 Tax=Lentithecium fluviatile CBS 122367 TaxID=1168545 RepID=A0A6G1IDA1_9PLEO|nr:hypothetical protein K458DRAFT_322868 [Lentithecium fluviatile CBS 122367]